MKNTLEQRVAHIEKRNERVEADKAWETSFVRRFSIMLLTYIVVVAYLHFVVKIEPWLNAIVPVAGFILSTLTLTALKNLWLKYKGYRT